MVDRGLCFKLETGRAFDAHKVTNLNSVSQRSLFMSGKRVGEKNDVKSEFQLSMHVIIMTKQTLLNVCTF